MTILRQKVSFFHVETLFCISLCLLVFFSSCKKDDSSDTDVKITIVADAGNDQTVSVGEEASLDGSGSTVSDPVAEVTYAWVFVSRPQGSINTIDNSLSNMSPLASYTPDKPGEYLISLTVWVNGFNNADTMKLMAVLHSNADKNAE